MVQAIASCEQHWPGHAQFLSAQAHLAGFYQRHGFVAVSDSYLEDDIPHIDMRRAGEINRANDLTVLFLPQPVACSFTYAKKCIPAPGLRCIMP